MTNMSKIQSESNSQQDSLQGKGLRGCDQYVKDTIWKQFTTSHILTFLHIKLWPICQRYNLKAIHNAMFGLDPTTTVVTNMSKIQSESNSQQYKHKAHRVGCCDQYVKDTIWKQFTTSVAKATLQHLVVTNMSKIQSESNSQPAMLKQHYYNGCDQYVKDTIWKQFTTLAFNFPNQI